MSCNSVSNPHGQFSEMIVGIRFASIFSSKSAWKASVLGFGLREL